MSYLKVLNVGRILQSLNIHKFSWVVQFWVDVAVFHKPSPDHCGVVAMERLPEARINPICHWSNTLEQENVCEQKLPNDEKQIHRIRHNACKNDIPPNVSDWMLLICVVEVLYLVSITLVEISLDIMIRHSHIWSADMASVYPSSQKK